MENKNRIWVFVAYKNEVPFFSKLFGDHTELKRFSAQHSAENETNTYRSEYYDLTDKTFLPSYLPQDTSDGWEEEWDALFSERTGWDKRQKDFIKNLLSEERRKARERVKNWLNDNCIDSEKEKALLALLESDI